MYYIYYMFFFSSNNKKLQISCYTVFHVYIYIYIHIHVYIYICMHVHIYIHVYIYVYICMLFYVVSVCLSGYLTICVSMDSWIYPVDLSVIHSQKPIKWSREEVAKSYENLHNTQYLQVTPERNSFQWVLNLQSIS